MPTRPKPARKNPIKAKKRTKPVEEFGTRDRIGPLPDISGPLSVTFYDRFALVTTNRK